MMKIKKIINKITEILSLKELSILSAYLSYSLVLALIPIITIIVSVIGGFGISIDTVIGIIEGVLPNYASDIVVGAISGESFDFSIGILNIATFFGAGKGMYAIINTSNNLYNIENKSKIKDMLRAFLILIIMIVLMIFMIIVPMLGDGIVSVISYFIKSEDILEMINMVYVVFKWPVTLFLIFFAIKAIYIIAPSVKVRDRDATIGALITTIGWTIFTALFGYYISYFGKYDIVYGGLSSIIILLIWFYVISYILILGIVINTRKYNKLY